MNRTLNFAFPIYFAVMLPYNPLNAEVQTFEAGLVLPALHLLLHPS